MAFKRILVPVDFSDHSAKALETAIELAKTFSGSVHLLHAYPINTAVYPYGMILTEQVEREIREAAQRQLEEWTAKATAAGVEAEGQITPASASQAIFERAQELNADLIVMGTRGISGLQHVLLGSVAERTIRLASCPVLTVRA
jgi:nucleotide-binding universal stress UspA family protein